MQNRCLYLPSSLFYFFKDFIYLFLERGREGEREGEKHQCVVASHMPLLLGTWPTTQTCALIGNRTGDPLVCRLLLIPLSHTSQGPSSHLHLLFFSLTCCIWAFATYPNTALDEGHQQHLSCYIHCQLSVLFLIDLSAFEEQRGCSILKHCVLLASRSPLPR